MPCTCDGYPEPEPDVHNSKAAELLCEVMAEHEWRNEMSCFTKDQLIWWEEHKKRDKQRILQDLRNSENPHRFMNALNPYETRLIVDLLEDLKNGKRNR